MGYIPLTPFRRSISAALEPANLTPRQDMPEVNKWHLLQDIVLGRLALGLKSQEIAVLEVLLSFIPGKTIGPGDRLVVYPSNATICARLNGMPCSTMRRHLAKLVSQGLIARRDSPNGKRYQRRTAGELIAYGFDVSPLLARLGEIRHLAETARAAEAERAALREKISLQLRDLNALHHPELPCEALKELSQALRRKLSAAELHVVSDQLQKLIDEIHTTESVSITSHLSSAGAQNEHHYQNTNINHSESVGVNAETVPVDNVTAGTSATELRSLMATCTQIAAIYPDPITSWKCLQTAADKLHGMMGISLPVWTSAKICFGAEAASAILAAMLERFQHIRSPGAYLQSLCQRASKGLFRMSAMFAALKNRRESSQL